MHRFRQVFFVHDQIKTDLELSVITAVLVAYFKNGGDVKGAKFPAFWLKSVALVSLRI